MIFCFTPFSVKSQVFLLILQNREDGRGGGFGGASGGSKFDRGSQEQLGGLGRGGTGNASRGNSRGGARGGKFKNAQTFWICLYFHEFFEKYILNNRWTWWIHRKSREWPAHSGWALDRKHYPTATHYVYSQELEFVD